MHLFTVLQIAVLFVVVKCFCMRVHFLFHVSMQCMHSAILLWQVRLSVRPSVLMNGRSDTISWRSGRDIILVSSPAPLHIYTGTPWTWALDTRGWWENFANIAFYLGNGTIGPWSLIRSHRWPIDSCRLQWPWVTLKGRTRGVKFLWQISIIRSAIRPIGILDIRLLFICKMASCMVTNV